MSIRLCTLSLCLIGGLLPALASARSPRAVEFHVVVTAYQTSSWSASGAREWCSEPTLTVPYSGSGSVTIHATGATTLPLVPGAKPTAPLTLETTLERSGAFVERDSSVLTRPPGCPLVETDTAAATNECGHGAGTLAAALSPRGQPSSRLLTAPSASPPLGCPGIASVMANTHAEVPAAAGHEETNDGLQPVTLTGLVAPNTVPFAPTSVTGHASGAWNVDLPGGSLSVNTTSEAQVSISVVPMIAVGRGISNIHLGETYAALRRGAAHLGGVTVSDGGLLDADGQNWIWPSEVHVPQTETGGDYIDERVSLSTPAGAHSGPLRHGPPPAGARVAQISTTGSYEVTPTGAGEGMTLAALRKAEPHGHLIIFGGPIGWAVEGPGRHRTDFTLFRGIVQGVEMGCGQSDPREKGAPVSDSKIC